MNKLEAEAREWLEPYCHDNGFLADERNADTVAAFLAAFALEREQRWVRVEDGLPEYADPKWITIYWPQVFADDGLAVVEGRWWVDHWKWLSTGGEYTDLDAEATVVAWMNKELTPEPYTEGE